MIVKYQHILVRFDIWKVSNGRKFSTTRTSTKNKEPTSQMSLHGKLFTFDTQHVPQALFWSWEKMFWPKYQGGGNCYWFWKLVTFLCWHCLYWICKRNNVQQNQNLNPDIFRHNDLPWNIRQFIHNKLEKVNYYAFFFSPIRIVLGKPVHEHSVPASLVNVKVVTHWLP